MYKMYNNDSKAASGIMDFESIYSTCPICYCTVAEHLMAKHIEFHSEVEVDATDVEEYGAGVEEKPSQYIYEL
jgi:hypothetical protein